MFHNSLVSAGIISAGYFMPMSGLETLGKQVGHQTKTQGQEYLKRGAVRIVSVDSVFAEAMVSGPRPCGVELEREGKNLICSCDCLQFNNDMEICKHVWAALLALEKSGHLKKWEKNFPTNFKLLVFPKDDYGADDHLGFPEDSYYMANSDYSAGARARTSENALTEYQDNSWQRILDRVQQVHKPEKRISTWPEGREILYVIDRSRRFSEKNMVIRIDVRDRKKNGDWRKPKPLSLASGSMPELPDAIDQQIMDRLIGAERDTWYYAASHSYDSQMRFHLGRRELQALIPIIAGTGRMYICDAGNSELRPVVLDEEGPWEFFIDVIPDAPGNRHMVRGAFHRNGDRLDTALPAFLCTEGFLISDGKLAAFHGEFEWVDFFRREEAFFVPDAETNQWLEKMFNLSMLPPMHLPENLRLENVRFVPRPVIRIRVKKEYWGRSYPAASLQFDYEGNLIDADDPAPCMARIVERQLIERDFAAEDQARGKLESVGFRPLAGGSEKTVWTITQTRLSTAVRELVADGWQVEAEGKLFRNPGAFNMRISSGIDWFELHGDIDFEGARVQLPRLLAALKRLEHAVLLDDGSYGIIPEEWLKKYRILAGFGKTEGDHVRFKPHQVGILDALLASRPEVDCDELFVHMRNELRDFAGVVAADAPLGFQGELRTYQREGLGWMHFLQKFGLGGCLADDMGLGKTIQVLALLEERRVIRAESSENIPPSLVVMPRSLVFNWKNEAARFTPALRVLEHIGSERLRGHEHFDDYDVVFTTYGTLRRDAAFFREKKFDYLILDESQAIKNSATASAKSVRLLQGRHRLALSGTPIENHLGELWSLFEFLNPGMLGSASVFKLGKGEAEKIDDETRELLARALRPFILRRTKAQVASDLPEKMELTLFCTLEPAQRALYDELRDHYRQTLLGRIQSDGMAKSKMHVLEALLRLRQASLHPGLIDPKRADEPSAKMDMLLPQIREVIETGHKALVFSQFTSMLDLLRRRLDEEGICYEYLDGQTRNRAVPVERFQNDPERKLFLISLKAGGLGLNLTAAEYVFLLDPWWNPAVEMQAIDRTHRIGQTRSVFAYRIIAKDTVEEKVLELQASKRHIADAIINQDNSVLGNLKSEDLELLLS